MGTINKGIIGGFSGKVGTVVGANWRGKDIIRSRPKASKRRPTDNQLLQQMKFKLVANFLQPLREIQSLYFGQKSGYKSRLNLAMSYTINEAVDVVMDIPKLIFARVLVTKGDLVGFQGLQVVVGTGTSLDLSWTDNSAQGNASATDMLNIVCYCEELQYFEIYQEIASRESTTAVVPLSAIYQGKSLQVWLYLSNEKRTLASTSPYMGDFMLN